MAVIITSGTEVEDLRVWEFLENSSLAYSLEDVAQINVTLIGLKQMNWNIVKGKRTTRDYLNDQDEIVIQFEYTYNTDALGRIISYNRCIKYLDTNGDIGIKKEILKDLSDTYIIALNREIRQNQIDDLRGRGEDLRKISTTLPDPYKTQYVQIADAIDSLWVHYKLEIEEYVNIGNSSFRDAVTNETNPQIVGILNIVANQDGVTTVRDFILEEIN